MSTKNQDWEEVRCSTCGTNFMVEESLTRGDMVMCPNPDCTGYCAQRFDYQRVEFEDGDPS